MTDRKIIQKSSPEHPIDVNTTELPSKELPIALKDDDLGFTTIAIIVLGALFALACLVFIIVKVSRYFL